jgi:hypothetical protein
MLFVSLLFVSSVPFRASAAVSVCFHPIVPKLAVLKDNGVLEVWNTTDRWSLEMVNCSTTIGPVSHSRLPV